MEQHRAHITALGGQAVRTAAGSLALLLSALLLMATTARGQPLDDDWTGAYLGASLGVATDADGDVMRSLHGGYLEQRGTTTYGVELELAETDIGSPAGPVDKIARVKGRLGMVRREVHVYAVAGLAKMQGRFGSDTGFVLGAGAETHLTEHVTLGGELLHHQVSDFDGTGERFSMNTLTGRLNYRF
ncbi:porin family protein [Ferrimonas balearica]|nr:porin family protein [Ferrimonas balearica]